MRLSLRVPGLDGVSAVRFEEAVGTVVGVTRIDTWEGLATIEATTDALPAILDAARAAGFHPEATHETVEIPVAGMSCDACETLLESTIEKAFPGVTARAHAANGFIRLEGTHLPKAAALQSAIGEGKYRVEMPEERPSLISVALAFAAAGALGFMLSRIDGVSRALNVGDATSFGGAFFLGLFAGSSACMAVAGGIMLAVLGRRAKGEESGHFLPVGAFITGRVASYALFGALIGAIGAVLSPPVWVNGVLIFLASLFMIISGMHMLGIAPRGLRRALPRMPHAWRKRADAAARTSSAPLIAGAVTFFVPCGFTQALQFYALSSGSATQGAVVLGGFALGTVPALAVVGWAARAFDGRKAVVFMRFAGAAVVLLGLSNLSSAATVAGIPLDLSQWMRINTPNEDEMVTVELPPIVDGKQIITMVSGGADGAYSPDRFYIRAGIPVEWRIDQRTIAGCLSEIISRPLAVKMTLVKGENVLTFTAPEPGTYGFSCGMGMFRGDIIAVPS